MTYRKEMEIESGLQGGGFRFHETRDCSALADGQSKANEQGKDTYNPQFVEREEAIRFGKKPCLVCKPKLRRG